MKKRVLFLILILIVVLTAAACSAEIEYRSAYVTEISVSDLSKLDYVAGDEIDIDGAKLVIKYSDMSSDTIDLTADMLFDYDMNLPEEGKTVTVKYRKYKDGTGDYVVTDFKINVYDLTFSSVELASEPLRKNYVVGERISADGASINVKYEGGKVVNVKVNDNMLKDYDNQRVGEQLIYISFYGTTLYFSVVFEEKTVVAVNVLRNPNQNAVFLNYGERLDLYGMRLRLTYDNGLMPAHDYDEVADNVMVYVDDDEVGTVLARVAYFPKDYPETVTYSFGGSPLVSMGEYVYPNKEIAGNLSLDNVVSKTFGRVVSVDGKSVTVSTVVEYDVTSIEATEGQILLQDELIGRSGGQNVYATAGGGIVLSCGDGKVKMQTVPVTSFSINVKDRSYESMVIDTLPITTKYGSNVNDIIQGDSLNLSTGRVKVFFDNGETEVLSMSDSDIKVVNSDDDLLRSEIPDFSFTSIDNVKDLPVGRYELKYGLNHGYGDKVTAVATVVDETGKSVYVQQNRYVSLEAGLNYTVSVTASYNDGGKILVSECVYYLSTVGAGVRHSQLDITAAGRHKLLIIYGGVKTNSINMIVTVIQRYEKALNIVTSTDNISGRVFRKGDVIPISTLQYTITYNNGDVSAPTGITMDMLGENCTLTCDEVTDRKEIYFRIPNTEVKSEPMLCSVIPMPIKSIAFDVEPIDVFLRSPASNTNHVDLSGGIIRVYYENGKVSIIGKDGALLPELLANAEGTGTRIRLSYDENDSEFLSLEEINSGVHYDATLTYYDEDGASAELTLGYYIIDDKYAVSGIKVVLSTDYYKRNYVQCDDWDLTGVNMIVTYAKNGNTANMPVTKDMIYDSSTDVIGKDIPVKIRYLGKIDASTYKINVEARTEVALSVVKTGKDLYYNTDKAPDFSAYKFSLGYNAGASAEISGLSEFNGGKNKAGWWYEIYDEEGFLTQFRRAGNKIVRMYHTTEVAVGDSKAYTHVFTEFPIKVVEKTVDILRVEYEDTSLGTWNYGGKILPVLEIVAGGWELFLNEFDPTTGLVKDKYLTVYYVDETVGYVQITTKMVTDYSKNDTSKGYRKVTITHLTFSAEACVQVLDAEFTAIAVEKKPCTNFIAGSELTKDGGIIKCIYEVTLADNSKTYLYKYLYMDDDAVTCSGFNSSISPDVDNVSQDVTLTFRDKSTTYKVTIYNKQATVFKYQNTIFFYGNTKAASATPMQFIPEFTLPDPSDIRMWYVSSQYFIIADELDEYLLSHPDETEGEFMLLVCEDGIARYVNRKYLQSKYPVEPLKKIYDRYIVMEVLGNEFYRRENYCLQKYTVIPKVIEVSVIPYTETAYTLDYYVTGENNLPKAIMYLYKNLDGIVAQYTGGVVTSVELLSPNSKFFRIGVNVTNAFDEGNAEHVSRVDNIFTAIRKSIGDYLEGASNVSANIAQKRKGINIGQYNGLTPEYVSYRIAAGETLTLNGVLELLEGSPMLAEYDYSTGEYDVSVGTLRHAEDHYTIDFVKAKYKVLTRKIDSYACTGNWDKESDTLTISEAEFADVGLPLYVIHSDDRTSRSISEDELRYYSAPDCNESSRLMEKPDTAGTYYVKVGADDSFSMHDINVSIKITLIIE